MGRFHVVAAVVAAASWAAVAEATASAGPAGSGMRFSAAAARGRARLRASAAQRVLESSFLQYAGQHRSPHSNYAYYGGNYLPMSPWHPNNRDAEDSGPYNNDPYWQDNPYWNYFKQVWGKAPFADANFRLWMSGAMKGFGKPRHPQKGQTTRALPAWLHYYHGNYNPLLDTPYASDYALFSENGEKAPKDALRGSEALKLDCSEEGKPRPCGVQDDSAYTYTPGRKKIMHPMHLAAGWVRLDNYWARANGDALPANMPKPPEEPPQPPAFVIGGLGEGRGEGRARSHAVVVAAGGGAGSGSVALPTPA